MVIQNNNFNKFKDICKNGIFTAPNTCIEIFDYINLKHIKIENIAEEENVYVIIMLTNLSDDLEITFSNKYTYKDLCPTLSNKTANAIIIHNGIKNMHANLYQLNELIKGA